MIILRLIKYRLSLAVTLTALVGYVIFNPSPVIDMLLTVAGVFLLAGGASALNQYQERKADSLMDRTRQRPIPSGAVRPLVVLEITLIMIIAGLMILVYLSWIAALLGLINVLLYNLIYTNLKKVTYLAIIPGALVGAIPPVMGWCAAGGSPFNITILYISFIIFLWQVPHFWMLLIRYHEDYEKAGFPTVMKKLDERQVKRIIFTWISLVSIMAMSSFFYGLRLNPTVWIITVILNVAFIVTFNRMLFGKNARPGPAFILSNIFISLLYLLFATGTILNK